MVGAVPPRKERVGTTHATSSVIPPRGGGWPPNEVRRSGGVNWREQRDHRVSELPTGPPPDQVGGRPPSPSGRDRSFAARARDESMLPLHPGAREAHHAAGPTRRMRALIGSRREQAPGVVRLPALHAGIRYVQSRLSPDEGRARLHAAAGPAADRRLSSAAMAGALHRREHRARNVRRFRMGRHSCGERHARAHTLPERS